MKIQDVIKAVEPIDGMAIIAAIETAVKAGRASMAEGVAMREKYGDAAVDQLEEWERELWILKMDEKRHT